MTGSKNTGSTTRKSPAAKSKMSGLGVIGELDRYYYGEGRHYKIFEKLGAHRYTYRGRTDITLRSGRLMQSPSAWSAILTAGIRMNSDDAGQRQRHL